VAIYLDSTRENGATIMIRRDWSNLLTNVIFPWNIQEVVLARVGFSVAFVVWLAWIGGKHFLEAGVEDKTRYANPFPGEGEWKSVR